MSVLRDKRRRTDVADDERYLEQVMISEVEWRYWSVALIQSKVSNIEVYPI